MGEALILSRLSVADKLFFERLKKLLGQNLRPSIIIIGFQTFELLRLFLKKLFEKYFNFTKIIDLNQNPIPKIYIRKLLLDSQNQDLLIILRFEQYPENEQVLHQLNSFRDLISHNKIRLLLLGKPEHIYTIIEKYMDLFSMAHFSYIFYDNEIESKEETEELEKAKVYQKAILYKNKITKSDKEQLFNNLTAISWATKMGDFKNALQLINKGYRIIKSKKLDFPLIEELYELKAEYLINFGKLYLLVKDLKKAANYLKQGIETYDKIIKNTPDPNLRIFYLRRKTKNMIRLGRAYIESGDLETARQYYKQAYQHILKIEKDINKQDEGKFLLVKERSFLYHELMYLYLRRQNIKNAEKILIRKYKLSVEIEYQIETTKAFVKRDYGIFYYFSGKYPKAKKSLEEARKIFEKTQLYRYSVAVELLLGKILLHLFHTGDAYHILTQSFKQAKQHRFIDLVIDILIELSFVMFYRGEYSKTINYLKESLKLAKETMYLKGQTKSIYLMAIVYIHLGKLTEAKQLLNELEIVHNRKYAKCIVRANMAKGFFYYKNNEINNALKFATKGVELAKKMNFFDYIPRYYYLIGEIYLKNNQPDLALQNFEKGYNFSVKHNFIEGKIINGFYYFDINLNKNLTQRDSLQKLKQLLQTAENAQFEIFLPRLYKKLATVHPNPETQKIFCATAEKITNFLQQNVPDNL